MPRLREPHDHPIRLPLRLLPSAVLVIVLSAAFQLSCHKEEAATLGPVKLLFTGDVGGALDPCG